MFNLPLGTRSLIYGAHCFFLHPLFVFLAWRKLYGWPDHWAIWLAFLVHDWGYFGCHDMDGEEGEAHVKAGARIMLRLTGSWQWYLFSIRHSRHYAKKWDMSPSELCFADKYAICLTPAWLYIPLVRLTGEIHEYKAQAKAYAQTTGIHSGERAIYHEDDWIWYRNLQRHMERWVRAHIDGREDTWTVRVGAAR